MKNLRVYMTLRSGEQQSFEFDGGRGFIHQLFAHRIPAEPKTLVFEAQTSDGRTVRLAIPYSDTDAVRASIEE